MHEITIPPNGFLEVKTRLFFHTNYLGYRKPGNPDYINVLKNTYNDLSSGVLNGAVSDLARILSDDLPEIQKILRLINLTVCMVPRAKAETNYAPNQLLFKSTIRMVIPRIAGMSDGLDYIIRHINTKTTHLPPNTPNYNNDGDRPYPGITIDSCIIDNAVNGRDILLVDDLYTSGVNIDEDAIQALLDNGARSVVLYTIGCKSR